ncbi:VOC family protein [Pararhodobacter aggregans]|uniref:Polyphosphate kinase n=1 Tax=Pararhodobacter aggregans TaxID=404875 RepID=A0A2T7UXC1_9RHOB|nr:VOC family protein [Pararhodobacter aggregans]PTX04884.1 glyoxalase-like protein [Pararhodobacter aggregans]PVE49209.1 polyphosphate kinase [Pararhodobacter aggregans]
MIALDHIALAALSLDEGSAAIEAALGVPLEPGGRHAQMGTHNRLLSLGPGEYLELIAIDPEGQAPDRPRWFDLDAFAGETRPQCWILRTDDMEAALARAPAGTGVPTLFRRDALSWTFALPDSGQQPFDGTAPALIEWGEGMVHPSVRLPDRGVRLTGVTLRHPRPDVLRQALAGLIDEPRLTVETGAPGIAFAFDTPNGPRELA